MPFTKFIALWSNQIVLGVYDVQLPAYDVTLPSLYINYIYYMHMRKAYIYISLNITGSVLAHTLGLLVDILLFLLFFYYCL